MRYFFSIIFLLFIVRVGAAQMHEGVSLVTPSLHCGATNFTKPFTLGIKLKIAPHWHTYWKNPGDSGLPLEVTIDSASGYRIDPVQYPTPKKIPGDGSMSYGYEDSVVYLVRVYPPKDASEHPKFSLHLEWLVCKHVCLPGEADLEFDARSFSRSEITDGASLINRWTARLPQPGIGFNLENTMTTLTETKGGLIVRVLFNDLNPDFITDFYPEEFEGFVTDYTRIEILENGFTFPLQYEGKPHKPEVLRGIVLFDRQGYAVNIPVKQ